MSEASLADPSRLPYPYFFEAGRGPHLIFSISHLIPLFEGSILLPASFPPTSLQPILPIFIRHETTANPLAAYNVGSALMILLILISIVALYFYFRRKARLRQHLSLNEDGSLEERVPLGAMSLEDGLGSPRGKRSRKGKGRARELDGKYTPPLGRGRGLDSPRGSPRGHGLGLESSRGSGEVVFAIEDDEDEERERRQGR